MTTCEIFDKNGLKSCPFCRKKVHWEMGAIVCPKCLYRFKPHISRAKTKEAWNRRADG